MELQDFRIICDTAIDRYLDEIKARDKDWNCINIQRKRIQKIYRFYEAKRIETRRRYMEDPSKPLDRHKIASVMIYAILRSKIIQVDRMIPDLPEELLLANEYLAFYVALNIVEHYRRCKNIYSEEDYLLIFPEVYPLDNGKKPHSFLSNVCITLSNIRSLKQYDVFAYSTILFMLEKYTDKCRDEYNLD